MKEIKKIYPDDVVIDMSVNSAASSTIKLLSRLLIKRCQEVKYINHYRYLLFVCFSLLAYSLFRFIFFGIRYELLITSWFLQFTMSHCTFYITGSLCALFTILKNISAKDIIARRTPVEKIAHSFYNLEVLFARA